MPGAAELLKTVGLLADGPVRWGAQVRSRQPGLFLVEFPEPLPQAPVDASICGLWIERVPTLRLDGERPDGRQLARRLAGFWIPSQTVLYVGTTARALGPRVGALYATELGSRRPHSGGHWLKVLRGLDQARIWWAETDAVEEYEDALLAAFAAAVPPAEAAALHDPSVVLPFANLESPTGARKEHGITGSLLAAEEPAPTMVRRSVGAAIAGAAAGSRAAAGTTKVRAGGSDRPTGRTGPARAAAGTDTRTARPRTRAAAARHAAETGSAILGQPARRTRGTSLAQEPPKPAPTYLSPAGVERLEAELAELRDVQRPAVVARIKAARELGDLRENADYEAARREQSFIEGRIQAIEAILRTAHVVDEATAHEVIVGSTVVLETAGDRLEYSIVGSSEANPAEGRVSYVSPLGRALIGRRAGDDVVVRTPSGERHFRVVEVR